MNINHDYSYVSSREKELISRGYGEMGVHSLNFDRYYTEEQKQKSVILSHTMTNEEWNKHCDKVSESFNKPLEEILNMFVKE